MSIYRIRLIESLVNYIILLHQEVISTSNVLKSIMILKHIFPLLIYMLIHMITLCKIYEIIYIPHEIIGGGGD
jgi:hypothetical protein